MNYTVIFKDDDFVSEQSMSGHIEREINAIVELLKTLPPKMARLMPTRACEAERRVEAFLDGLPRDRLALLLAMIDANVHHETLALDLVSFIDEDDLPTLITKLLSRGATLEEDDSLLDHVALQRPELVPRQHLERMSDYTEWEEEGDAFAPPPTYHLIFEHGSPQALSFITHNRHPTWHLPAEGPSYRLGGPGHGRCPSCDQPLIHLMTLDRAFEVFLGSLPALVLETCPTCWRRAYYQHDHDGRPRRIDPIEIEGFRWKNAPLKEQKVRFAPTPKRWLLQSWGHSNGRQNLYRLGGLPAWVQNSDVPKVPQTERKMKLLLQLDSYLLTVDGSEMLWGSGGILYVFWDAETRVSCHFGQWT